MKKDDEQVEVEAIADPKPRATRDALLTLERPPREVEHPDYEFSFQVRALTAWEQSEYQNSLLILEYHGGEAVTRMNMVGSDARLCARGVVEPEMKAREWGKLPNDLVAFLAREIREASGMQVTVQEAAGN